MSRICNGYWDLFLLQIQNSNPCSHKILPAQISLKHISPFLWELQPGRIFSVNVTFAENKTLGIGIQTFYRIRSNLGMSLDKKKLEKKFKFFQYFQTQIIWCLILKLILESRCWSWNYFPPIFKFSHWTGKPEFILVVRLCFACPWKWWATLAGISYGLKWWV